MTGRLELLFFSPLLTLSVDVFHLIQLTVTIFDIQTKHNESVQQWLGPNSLHPSGLSIESGIMLILAARAYVH
jgi:hypothetical protein